MQIVDAHCHFWQLARGDYGWLDGEGGTLEPIRRDFLPSDHPGKVRLIVVQAAPSVTETDLLLSLAADEARIAGVVGWVDLTEPQAVDVLRERAANPLFKGIRPMLQDIAETDWLTANARPDVLDVVTELGLRFDALVTERHLPMLADFAAGHPDLPIVIDHAAKPQPGARPEWEAGMRALAGQPHVHCKLSGLMTELSRQELDDPLPALRTIFDRLLDWLGPDRLIWGSDWPVLQLAASWQTWRMLTDTLLRQLAERERDAIMRGNAAAFYGVSA